MKVEWISVEDRVPDESVDVLVSTKYVDKRYVSVGHRHGPFWLGSESHEVLLGEVVAWTELPEPAEE
ncbi:MAG: DUF551 domain-containing protein [Rhodospirillaceae bacterium]|jgi:hypothetical protein|nr:DUF551 domain-containing protein [Rhodospirillales bacterium]MBT3906111.1 DUF551 domain-containing protein [Rhodospirillaceae bacterium]MBT4699571.1 DUF551 domain-containing protein [Rhodospirillaceae bacterium]MBT5036087.1 DUF551 domain-containing protein [Rhodospirillaceae bacterium]MBT6220529.1 DUF551 domain-containing protein [Rhodospirillaceae bacterium]